MRNSVETKQSPDKKRKIERNRKKKKKPVPVKSKRICRTMSILVCIY